MTLTEINRLSFRPVSIHIIRVPLGYQLWTSGLYFDQLDPVTTQRKLIRTWKKLDTLFQDLRHFKSLKDVPLFLENFFPENLGVR
jgi:hypothetical protein